MQNESYQQSAEKMKNNGRHFSLQSSFTNAIDLYSYIG